MKNILVIEDDTDLLFLFDQYKNNFYKLHSTDNDKDALKILYNNQIDLVIEDVYRNKEESINIKTICDLIGIHHVYVSGQVLDHNVEPKMEFVRNFEKNVNKILFGQKVV